MKFIVTAEEKDKKIKKLSMKNKQSAFIAEIKVFNYSKG
jgi:hypothetical protein